jgi:hypothetical protein
MKALTRSGGAHSTRVRPGFRGNGAIGTFYGPATNIRDRYTKSLINAKVLPESQKQTTDSADQLNLTTA